MVESNYEEQADEVESLTYIYCEDFELKSEQPYNFEIMLNSNTESEDKNFLKLKITFDLQQDYPQCVPYFRIKNLSQDYLDNTVLDKWENLMREKAEELIGSMMIFEITDFLKEKIVEINDEVLAKLQKIEDASKAENTLKQTATGNIQQLSYTPVTPETFGKWCAEYKVRLDAARWQIEKQWAGKPTGKQLFEMNKTAFDDLTLDLQEEETVVASAEEKKAQESEEEEDFKYDKALYDPDELIEDDLDFD